MGIAIWATSGARGAAALIVARPPDPDGEPPLDALGDVTVVHVADPLQALHAIAAPGAGGSTRW